MTAQAVPAVSAISIHAAREGGDDRRRVRRYRAAISIHAAREGGDRVSFIIVFAFLNFNPRRP